MLNLSFAGFAFVTTPNPKVLVRLIGGMAKPEPLAVLVDGDSGLRWSSTMRSLLGDVLCFGTDSEGKGDDKLAERVCCCWAACCNSIGTIDLGCIASTGL